MSNYGLPEDTSAQGIFDHVAAHLLQQGLPSMCDDEELKRCVYRSGDMACAIGCLVGDATAKLWDAHGFVPSAHDVRRSGALALPAELQPHVLLLRHLQYLHDNGNGDGDDWTKGLAKIAKEHGLEFTPEVGQ